ncbi:MULTISPECIES: helix-turn-helix domain-containing protein [Neorhizobium]|uniref:helix-turn-helix domain-containing protein n=1 Tax=Neorhizobium TaxID=1525371 RepID=UPI00055EF54C|nr:MULTISPECIES: helix-turn-helix transcriptional regulator [Neorhizobium]
MKLAQYLTEQNLSPEQFAAVMDGMSTSGVRKWMYGERVPRPDQMRKIAEFTGGLVQPNDFVLVEAAE